MRLHWHRRDLRLADNRGLASAEGEEPILPVFVIDEEVHRHAGPPRIVFLLDALHSLRAACRERGSDLIVRRGDPAVILPELSARADVDVTSACADYSGLARERDERVRATLANVDVTLEQVHDAVLVPPGAITTASGTPYAVFRYYAAKWHQRAGSDPVPEPDASALAGESVLAELDSGEIPDLDTLHVDEPCADVPPAGTEPARDRLQSFLADDVYEYDRSRDRPAADCMSRLSPHLKFGTIGVREVYEATEAATSEAPDQAGRDGVETFQDQLAWRDFYAEQLAEQPDMIGTNVTEYANGIEWRQDKGHFRSWTRGETGYPIVDAGMRQLRAEAWMHNRVRMIVASFLTKDLRIDWRWGYAWFREKLVDHDPANDAGGWQWAASTGTDAQPFFRVFNPVSQAEQHDPDGEYVRRYVPELADLETEAILDWPNLPAAERSRLAPDYPAPIVDHGTAREAALAMYRRARGEEA